MTKREMIPYVLFLFCITLSTTDVHSSGMIVILVQNESGEGVESKIHLKKGGASNLIPVAVTDSNGRRELEYKCEIGDEFRANPIRTGEHSYSEKECTPNDNLVSIKVRKIVSTSFDNFLSTFPNRDTLSNRDQFGLSGYNLTQSIAANDHGTTALIANEVVQIARRENLERFEFSRFEDLIYRSTAAAIGTPTDEAVAEQFDGVLMSDTLKRDLELYQANNNLQVDGILGIRTLHSIAEVDSFSALNRRYMTAGTVDR